MLGLPAKVIEIVSIHAPVRERRMITCHITPYQTVSIHAPVRERRPEDSPVYTAHAVSIHAPVRERHGVSAHLPRLLYVSIHAPVRERPPAARFYAVFPLGFNSRSREGATDNGCANVRGNRVSIHAPVRERQVRQRHIVQSPPFQFTLP